MTPLDTLLQSGMQIIVNGKPESHPEGTTVAQLLTRHSLADAPCAVEVNKVLVPKREHSVSTLAPADVIEIVTFVGGG